MLPRAGRDVALVRTGAHRRQVEGPRATARRRRACAQLLWQRLPRHAPARGWQARNGRAHQLEYRSKTAAVLSVAALARGGSALAPPAGGSFSRSLSRLRGVRAASARAGALACSSEQVAPCARARVARGGDTPAPKLVGGARLGGALFLGGVVVGARPAERRLQGRFRAADAARTRRGRQHRRWRCHGAALEGARRGLATVPASRCRRGPSFLSLNLCNQNVTVSWVSNRLALLHVKRALILQYAVC